MANWITPVYDRTESDVSYARQQLSKGINDVEYKGCFNVTDSNRIENNTRYLSDTLRELCYQNGITTKTDWNTSSYISISNVSRIINNIDILWKKYHTPTGAISLPSTLLTYEHINNIEKNQYLIKVLLDDMINSFRQCNTFECGEA